MHMTRGSNAPRLVSATLLSLISCSVVCAEHWPTLERYVNNCSLIVLCETEIRDERAVFKVIEAWKGQFHIADFKPFLQERAPGPGYLPANLRLHSGHKPQAKQKVVFFFTGDPYRQRYSGSSTSFEVRNKRLVYAETNHVQRKEFTLDQFKKSILAIVAEDNGPQRTADAAQEDTKTLFEEGSRSIHRIKIFGREIGRIDRMVRLDRETADRIEALKREKVTLQREVVAEQRALLKILRECDERLEQDADVDADLLTLLKTRAIDVIGTPYIYDNFFFVGVPRLRGNHASVFGRFRVRTGFREQTNRLRFGR